MEKLKTNDKIWKILAIVLLITLILVFTWQNRYSKGYNTGVSDTFKQISETQTKNGVVLLSTGLESGAFISIPKICSEINKTGG